MYDASEPIIMAAQKPGLILGEGLFSLESLGFGLFIAFGKPSLILGEGFMLVVRRLGL